MNSASPVGSFSPADMAVALAAGKRSANELQEQPTDGSIRAGASQGFRPAGGVFARLGLGGEFGAATNDPKAQPYFKGLVNKLQGGPFALAVGAPAPNGQSSSGGA